MSTTTRTRYLLGHDEAELARLEAQARVLAPATSALLALTGVGRGLRVLDLGTGVGGVAFLAANRVGPGGSVLAVSPGRCGQGESSWRWSTT